jgi:hypothetical protein
MAFFSLHSTSRKYCIWAKQTPKFRIMVRTCPAEWNFLPGMVQKNEPHDQLRPKETTQVSANMDVV